MSSKGKKPEKILNRWQLNFLLTLIILLVMATIQDLGVSYTDIISF